MAVSQFALDYRTYPSSSHSLLQPGNHFHANKFWGFQFQARSSHRTVELEHHQPKPTRVAIQSQKQKRKPRPSFFDQVRDKWSLKLTSRKQKLPWQEGEEEGADEVPDELVKEQSTEVEESDPEANSTLHRVWSDSVSYPSSSSAVLAPWSHGSKPQKSQLDFVPKISQSNPKPGVTVQSFVAQKLKKLDVEFTSNSRPVDSSTNEKAGVVGVRNGIFKSSKDSDGYVNGDTDAADGDGWKSKRSNTETAERMIPEHELRRLRNVALRMVERTKVGGAGITQELVDQIHQKWKSDEVVKLKFELPLSRNMKRTHEVLERRTGGLVIWRSGSSLVLFRGMSYKFHCVKSYARQNQEGVNALNHSNGATTDAITASLVSDSLGFKDSLSAGSFTPFSSELLKDKPEEHLLDLCELDQLLDELGPRYNDWSGREPLPVDADQLPAIVPGYKTPFRLLPYGVRHCLRDKEMTEIRMFAREAPSHFVLGRNRELEGLAKAMVKLWEKSAIAKIAIKRGVLNTRNERMAEELKKLTGGTLISRNKEYIVFYRGNDFLPPSIMDMLIERQNLRNFKQDEEEAARQRGLDLMDKNAKPSKSMAVAGTLAESRAANSHWRHQPSSGDIKKMMRDDALTRQASFVRHLEKKLTFAKGKLKKAEKALAKVQEFLEPSDLPTDLETLSDEERFLFRKIGLSMKTYLLLGRRGVYDGTIENMHLHWKHRELVKVIVKGKTLAQVKHIAISLEAESGGILVSLDKTTKGYAVIIYRGKNYMRPRALRPKNLLTRRQALARSIELQRREALKHHILDLQGKIGFLKSELEEMKAGKEINVDKTSHLFSEADFSDEDAEEDEGEEAYLETYDHVSDSDDGEERKQFVR